MRRESREKLNPLLVILTVNLYLVMSQFMSISISDGKLAISKGFELREKVEKYIFTSSLIGFTI